ncbi:MAG: radical SAM protein [Candidatus Nealsonbacteria bacterium]
MKILLINPPVFNDVGRVKSQTPPLGLLYLAAYLEKNGFQETKVIDTDLAKLTWQDLKDLFIKEKPDILGISGPSFVIPAMAKTVEIARNILPDSLIIVGGFGPTKEPEKLLKTANGAINLVVMGEGEITLLEVVKRRESGSRNFDDIAGLAFLDEIGNLKLTKPRDFVMDLDSLPWPAFHLLQPDFSKYHGAPLHPERYQEMKFPRATMLASRGCPHRCAFCSLVQRSYRQRDPKDVVSEMEFYKNKFGVKSIQLYDDEFIGMSPQQDEWIERFCEEILRRKINLPWLAQGRCSQFVKLETLKKMKAAGCCWIWWGVESGSQKVLDIIKKDIKVENVYRTFDLAKEAGLKSLMFIMIGFPGETPEDIKLTIKLIENIKPDDVAFHILSPWPGSELRQYLLSNNLLDNIDDYYQYGTNMDVSHHTKEMTAEEIRKYYRLLIFRFGHSRWHFIKFGLKSLTTRDGWEKLLKRIKIVFEYFLGWLKIKINR